MKSHVKRSRSLMAKRLLLVSILGSFMSTAFMNCGQGFKVDQSGLNNFSSQLGSEAPVDLKFDAALPDQMNAFNASVAFTAKSSTSEYSLKCYLNSVLMAACANPIDLSAAAEGDQSLRITAVNRNGLVLSEINRVFRIDKKAPSLTITSAPAATIGLTSVNVQFSATDNFSQGNQIVTECALDQQNFTTCSSPKSYSSLAVGPHSIKIRAIDLAKNTSDVTVINFGVALGLPSVSISQNPSAYSNSKTATFAFVGTSSNETISGYECSIDNGSTYSACASPKTYSNLSDGVYTFAVRAKDSIDQVSSPAKVNFTVDTVAPTTPVLSSNLTSPSKSTAINLSFNSNDASGIAKYECSVDDANNFAVCTSPKSFAGLSNGQHIFRVKATDQAGNVSTDGTFVMVTDLVAPSLSVTSSPSNPSSDRTAVFQFTSTDADSGIGLTECQLDTEGAYSTCSSPKVYNNVAKGNRVFSVRTTDKAGNSAIQTYAWTVADTVPTPTPTPTDPGAGGNPLTSIDTGTDPNFAPGAASVSINGAQINVTAARAIHSAAGIYKSDGTLVRTLWRKKDLSAGQTNSVTWDYKDDFGAMVADGAYQVKVMAHNVEYKWQGVIGNTSSGGAAAAKPYQYNGYSFPLGTLGQQIHRSFHAVSGVAITPQGSAFLTTSYNEQQPAIGRFELTNPQVKTQLIGNDFQRIFEIVATDGKVAYFANRGSYDGGFFYHPENFIVGVNISNNNEYIFSSGKRWTNSIAGVMLWSSVIDVVNDGGDQINGMAVEVNGNNLYVAHKNSGVKILDKTTGACKIPAGNGECSASFGVPSPGPMALDKAGNLYVVAKNGTEIRKYSNPGSNPQQVLTFSGFGQVTGLGLSPITNTLVVVDGGADQQLKAYNTSTGAQVWVQGMKGGYNVANGPEVSLQKLALKNSASNFNYIAFEPSNTDEIFWFGEPGNYRNLRVKVPSGSSGANPLVYLDQIMYVPVSYNAAVDKVNPTRVFNTFLEFAVDYSKPFTQSWKLVRNWEASIPDAYKNGLISGPRDLYTTPQGRTYGLLESGSTNTLFELTSAGMRNTGVNFGSGTRLVENMNVRYQKEEGGKVNIYQRDFTGVDGSGNPVYSAAYVAASAPQKASNGKYNAYYHEVACANGAQEPQFPKTSTGVIITFDPCAYNSGDYDANHYHLGGIKAGASNFLFSTSPGGGFQLADNKWIIDGDGTFNLEKLPQNYAGSAAMASGRHVIYNYFGEFWNDSQSTQWMHFLDNGLFLGQFGVVANIIINQTEALVGSAGNTFANTMVTVDGNIYIYHNDESVHAGTHRWRVQNLKSIQEANGSIGKNTAVTNPASIATVQINQ